MLAAVELRYITDTSISIDTRTGRLAVQTDSSHFLLLVSGWLSMSDGIHALQPAYSERPETPVVIT